jgi:hypothetical protein
MELGIRENFFDGLPLHGFLLLVGHQQQNALATGRGGIDGARVKQGRHTSTTAWGFDEEVGVLPNLAPMGVRSGQGRI